MDNYTVLRFPSRCTKVTSESNVYTSGVYNDTEDDAKTIRSYTKNILKVELPDTVKELGEAAFSGEGDSGAFNFSSLERIELSKSLSKIEDWTFSDCKNLKYVKMPDNITEIGFMAFDGCGALESITIPEGVKTIGSSAFSGWTSSQTIKFRATKAGDNWDKYWNYNDSLKYNNATISANIIWGYQDNNT